MIKNEPKIKGGIIDLNRAQIEHRAAVMALTYQQAVDKDFDGDDLCRTANFKSGEYFGQQELGKMEDKNNVGEFCTRFFNGIALKTFEIEIVSNSIDEVILEFHYCPLVSMWQKLGIPEATIDKLCDIAMETDRSIAKVMGYKLDITQTIASGCESCRMKFYR
jgi:hypothetical protein